MNVIESISNFFEQFKFNPSGGIDLIRMLIDIGLAWAVIYYILKVVRKNNKTTQIFKGVVIIVLLKVVSDWLKLTTITWLTDQVINWGVLALIVIFQPEFRLLLEKIGQSNILANLATLTSSEAEKMVVQIAKAVENLASNRIGAIITIERNQSLDDYIDTGTRVDSRVDGDILQTIFMPNTPLHDGAVIIKGNKIACASAYFPPTRVDLDPRYGARHRAAMGISEISDCLTIVVSEETGNISLAFDGHLERVSKNDLKERLMLEIGFGTREHGGEEGEPTTGKTSA